MESASTLAAIKLTLAVFNVKVPPTFVFWFLKCFDFCSALLWLMSKLRFFMSRPTLVSLWLNCESSSAPWKFASSAFTSMSFETLIPYPSFTFNFWAAILRLPAVMPAPATLVEDFFVELKENPRTPSDKNPLELFSEVSFRI